MVMHYDVLSDVLIIFIDELSGKYWFDRRNISGGEIETQKIANFDTFYPLKCKFCQIVPKKVQIMSNFPQNFFTIF